MWEVYTNNPQVLHSKILLSVAPFFLPPLPLLPSLSPTLQICSILHSYKECKPHLKREGWEQSAYVRMQREYAGQFEFESAGASSRQSKHKKRSTVKEDKKRRTEREGGEGGRQQGGVAEVPRAEEPRPPSLRRSSSPQEPGYQTIATATAAAATARLQPAPGAQQPREHVYLAALGV